MRADRHVPVDPGAVFLGPKGENADVFERLLLEDGAPLMLATLPAPDLDIACLAVTHAAMETPPVA